MTNIDTIQSWNHGFVSAQNIPSTAYKCLHSCLSLSLAVSLSLSLSISVCLSFAAIESAAVSCHHRSMSMCIGLPMCVCVYIVSEKCLEIEFPRDVCDG